MGPRSHGCFTAELGTMTQQRQPFAYLQVSHEHPAGPAQGKGGLEAPQRRGAPAWERGPAFLASSLGLLPEGPCHSPSIKQPGNGQRISLKQDGQV